MKQVDPILLQAMVGIVGASKAQEIMKYYEELRQEINDTIETRL